MVFACSISRRDNKNLESNPNFKPACTAFESSMRQSGYLLASLEGSTAGYLERRAFGELNFDALESEGDPLSALWLLEARDLNHVIALFDEHPVLSSFGVMIRALKRDGK